MTGESLSQADIDGMVETLAPTYSIESITKMEKGTDSVYGLTVQTEDGSRELVLKATTASHMPTDAARAEPHLLAVIDRETDIPVPTVHGYRDDHPDYPAPFFLMDRVPGSTLEDIAPIEPRARERIVETAGRHLAMVHELGTWPAAGRIGYRDGEFRLLDSDDHPQFADSRDWALDHAESAIDSLPDGGYFPTDEVDCERFADLVSDLRAHVRERIPALPEPDPPRWANGDYRYGNLVVDVGSGAVQAVLDWGMVSAVDPAYNIAVVEAMLCRADGQSAERTATLRKRFRTGYRDIRPDFAFDGPTRERIECYRLVYRLDAMACFGLWYRDATQTKRDERARALRSFIEDALEGK